MAEYTAPTGDTIWDEAVRSVMRRGFYATLPPVTEGGAHGLLLAQFLRLVEEAGELSEAWRKYPYGVEEALQAELADMAIVLSQMAYITGLPMADLDNVGPEMAGILTPSEAVGGIGRALRKWDGISEPVAIRDSIMVAMAVILFNDHVMLEDEDVAKKLAADELRGQLHGHSWAPAQNGGGS